VELARDGISLAETGIEITDEPGVDEGMSGNLQGQT